MVAHQKFITECWTATHLVEIYCNVGNPQLFPVMHRRGVCLVGGGYLTLVSTYVQYLFEYF